MRRLAMAVGLLAALGVLFVGLLPSPPPAEPAPSAAPSGDPPRAEHAPALSGRASQPVTDRTIGVFKTATPALRAQILRDLLAAGLVDARLLPYVLSMAEDESLTPRARALAMVMRMRIERTNRHVPDIAEMALDGRIENGRELLAEFVGAPYTELVLLAAERRKRSPEKGDDELWRAIESPAGLLSDARSALKSMEIERVAWAVQLLRASPPLPAAWADAVGRVLGSGESNLVDECLSGVSRVPAADVHDLPALTSRLSRLGLGLPIRSRVALLRVLATWAHWDGNVQALADVTIRDAASGPEGLDALGGFGPRAQAMTPLLLEQASRANEYMQPALSRALASLGAAEAVPYLSSRLGSAPLESERRGILDALPRNAAASLLHSKLVSNALGPGSDLAHAAIRALVRSDPALENQETEATLLTLLRGTKDPRQVFALEAFGGIEELPDEFLAETIRLLESPSNPVVFAATNELRRQTRDPRLAERIAPRVFAALGDSPGRPPLARAALLEAAGTLKPKDPVVRRHLLAALETANPLPVREGALRGYVAVGNPTVPEVYAVATQVGTNVLVDEALTVLDSPPWKVIVDREQVITPVMTAKPFR